MYTLVRIAWRNLWRNTRRTILSILAIAFAVVVLVFMMALQQGSYADMIRNAVETQTGYLQIQHPDYLDEKNIFKAFGNTAEIIQLVRDTEHVTGAAPRVNGPALVSFEEHTAGALVLGIDPEAEKDVTRLSRVIQKGGYLESGDRSGVVVGEILAKNLNVDLGDQVAFIGQGADGSMAAGLLTVRGIFKTGQPPMDKNVLAAHIDTIGQAYALSMDGDQTRVHEIAINIDALSHLEDVHASLVAKLADGGFKDAVALTWDQVLPGVKESIQIDWRGGQIMYGVLLMVVGFGIMNVFLMSFLERTREFGVLMAVGMKPRQVSWLILLEAMTLTLVGLAVGAVAGSALTFHYQVHGIDFGEKLAETFAQYGMDPVIHPALHWWILAWTAVCVLVIAAVVAIYPAYKVTRLKPVEAIRHV